MPDSILMTKLHIPKAKQSDVLRNDLIDKLDRGLTTKLTLISASAGFGKTTILSQWVNSIEIPVAWLSLDNDHSDISHFLVYLIAALKTIFPEIAIGISEALQSLQPPTRDFVLTALINDIAKSETNAVLVLDDYHLVESAEVDKALLFLIDNLPEEMHMVIATREDPLLPLARYRARRQLSELRAGEFLRNSKGVNLSEEDISLLESRTEGWIACLQLAAISLRGRDDQKEFVKSFSGSHRFILDYLVEEVLGRQTEEVQNFLMQTSIIKRLCGSLCDAVVPGNMRSGQDILERIEQSNLFVIALDDERKWFRYHHLFAQLLQQRLESTTSAEIPVLQKRASIWLSTV